MFKSASERLQIRKKRKTSQNRQPSRPLDPLQIGGNYGSSSGKSSQQRNGKRLRDRQQQPESAAIKMPLSQGRANRSSIDSSIGSSIGSNSKTAASLSNPHRFPAGAASPAAITAARKLSGENGGSSSSSSKLQLSYLLGESLARCGRLQEAFDVYALIARDLLEGCVPLDRLNALATCLVDHLRQQQPQLPEQRRAALADDSKTAWKPSFKVKSNNHAAAAAAAAARRGTWKEVASVAAAAAAISPPPAARQHGALAALALDAGDSFDPLLCPLCQDILRCPVTTNCGHTFCRQCCETITACNICEVKFGEDHAAEHLSGDFYAPSRVATSTLTPASPLSACSRFGERQLLAGGTSNSGSNALNGLNLLPSAAAVHLIVTTTTVSSTTATATTTTAASPSAARSVAGSRERGGVRFMPDVLVRRLVEKWWGADLQAAKISETAASYMHLNLLDDALKFCNASLEKSPTNFKCLLLRAEVLRKLNHFQSALADVDNALKSRHTSAKAHYERSLTLLELGRLDEALYDSCLAISLDRSCSLSSSELFQHDLAKLLQKLLAQGPPSRPPASHRTFATAAPYSVLAEHRLRRKQIGLLSNANGDRSSSSAKRCEELAVVEELERALMGLGHQLSPSAAIYANVAQDCELALHGQHIRKHCRRKWATRDTELLPRGLRWERRCSDAFRSALSRTQQEVRRLTELQSSADARQRQLVPVRPGLVDASDFDCVLCCRTFWRPVVTPCGHTYCWVCLDRCMDYTSSCPLCMSPLVEPLGLTACPPGASSPVPFALAKRPVTKFLEAAMKRFIPESYARRLHQEVNLEPSVPLFICTAAFPHVPCPLFVYEPRYRLMVRRAVESGEKQFGIVQPHNGKTRYFDVGTVLDIRDCVLLGDGCTILSTVGCKRFKILARNEKDGYETAKVEYICDEAIAGEQVASVRVMHAAVLHKANEWIGSLSDELKQEILQSFGEMPALEDNWERLSDGPAWAWWIIALLPLSQQLKVDILATTSLEKRLRAIEKTLDYISGNFRRSTQQDCSVVVRQQQQHHHHHHQQHQHQQQQQHQQHCDNDLAANCQAHGCCLAAATTAVLVTNNDSRRTPGSEQHTQLLL